MGKASEKVGGMMRGVRGENGNGEDEEELVGWK
jgi:hypothetical protein